MEQVGSSPDAAAALKTYRDAFLRAYESSKVTDLTTRERDAREKAWAEVRSKYPDPKLLESIRPSALATAATLGMATTGARIGSLLGGAVLGVALGGPVGAIVGAALGATVGFVAARESLRSSKADDDENQDRGAA